MSHSHSTAFAMPASRSTKAEMRCIKHTAIVEKESGWGSPNPTSTSSPGFLSGCLQRYTIKEKTQVFYATTSFFQPAVFNTSSLLISELTVMFSISFNLSPGGEMSKFKKYQWWLVKGPPRHSPGLPAHQAPGATRRPPTCILTPIFLRSAEDQKSH